MYSNLGGWHLIGLFVWLVMVLVAAAALFFLIRFAVLSALKAHTVWLESRGSSRGNPPLYGGTPPGAGEPPQA